nr:hypothetical protein GCM10020092_045930 [Actinoplanes digitatis]
MVVNAPKPPHGEELPQAGLDPGRVPQRVVPLAAAGQRRVQHVRVRVLRDQRVDLAVRHRVDDGDQVVHPVRVDGDAEPQLGLDLVALGDRHVPHVVAEAREPQAAQALHAGRGPGPAVDAGHHARVGGVPRHGFAGHAHPGLYVAELPVAVRGLVEVHEVHVDGRPGQRLVQLGVQVQQRLAQRVQPGDPHLG